VDLYRALDGINESADLRFLFNTSFVRGSKGISVGLYDINLSLAQSVRNNTGVFAGMSRSQMNLFLVETEQSVVQVILDTYQQQDPEFYADFVRESNLFVNGAGVPVLDNILSIQWPQARSLALAQDRVPGGQLNIALKSHRVLIGMALIEGAIEDQLSGRPACGN
jgi:hypothetical protein